MGGEAPSIIAVGLVCLDHLARIRAERARGYWPIEDYLAQGGGLTATAAVAAARLGAQVEFWTRVGDDFTGRFLLDELRGEGVGVSSSVVVAGATSPVSLVHVDAGSGERTIYHFPGRLLDAPAGGLPYARIAGAACLLLDDWWRPAAQHAAEAACAAGVPVVADLFPNHANADLVARVSHLVVAKAHFDAASPASPADLLRRLHGLGPRVVALTMGAEGCWYSDGAAVGHAPAFQVEPVVDTTGAGDVFHGAFGYALARGWDLDAVVEFASAVAALKCRKLGGRTGIPTLPEALGFLRAQGAGPRWAGTTSA
jgi:sulfofructose kinase